MTKKNMGLLLGAGISLPEYPSTRELTNIVLGALETLKKENRTDSKTYQTLYLLNPEQVEEELKLQNLVLNEFKSFYSDYSNREINYEDVYYIFKQLVDNLRGEYENPIVQYYLDNSNFRNLYHQDKISHEQKLLDNSLRYLEDVKKLVVAYLTKNISNFEGLHFLSQLLEKSKFNKKYIFTLNHDTYIEQYLSEKDIVFSDGFYYLNKKLLSWNCSKLKEETHNVQLIKLHGSIDWFPKDQYTNVVKRNRSYKGYLEYDIDEPNSIMLIGGFNKILEYHQSVFFDLQTIFSDVLRNKIHLLLISGYSFGDKGINTRIVEWMYKDKTNKLIVIDPNVDGIKSYSRGAIRNNWDIWRKENRIFPIKKMFRNISFEEIKDFAE